MTIRTIAAAALLSVAALGGAANAGTLSIDYFTIGERDRDANHIGWGTVDNEVQSLLGPNGLPVLNTAAFGCSSNCFSLTPYPQDVTAGGEITYWSPSLNNGGSGGTSDVVYTGTGIVSLPFNVPSNFFPPNGTGSSDYRGFQAAKLYGTVFAPTKETISFSIGADDMAFAYLDGVNVCDLGGVHADTPGTCTTPFLISAGSHNLDVFFVDINNVQSGLTFDVLTQGVVSNPGIPEPLTLSLFGAGLAGAAAFRRRRKASATK
jgi:hypothetical protein